MDKFAKSLTAELNSVTTTTENGALAYATSGHNLLDMNFKLSSYRAYNVPDDIVKDFIKAWAENPRLAVKFLFFAGDVRQGAGERKVFRACLHWLAKVRPDWTKALLPLVAEYNRWDSLLAVLWDTPVSDAAIALLHKQLLADQQAMREGKPVSLCAKWLPSINTSSRRVRRTARLLAKAWGMSERQYRKALAALRDYLNVTEVRTSANQWSSIDYAAVPSQANIRYRNAFLRHDEERRRQYLGALEKGDTKINASVTAPHEIVQAYRYHDWYVCGGLGQRDASLEALWKALPDYVQGDNSSIAVVDSSGSMFKDMHPAPCDVATGLGIYFAEHLSGAFKGKYITFSSRPQLVDVGKVDSLHEKLLIADEYAEISNTNIKAVFDLILRTAIDNSLPQDELPRNIIIFSDMEFDYCAEPQDPDAQKVLFEVIAQKYAEAGYKLPRLVFWNICGRTNGIPLQRNENGVALMSGFSTALVQMALRGTLDPFALLLETLNAPRYDKIDKALDSVVA